jgi:hypothetical protein
MDAASEMIDVHQKSDKDASANRLPDAKSLRAGEAVDRDQDHYAAGFENSRDEKSSCDEPSSSAPEG